MDLEKKGAGVQMAVQKAEAALQASMNSPVCSTDVYGQVARDAYVSIVRARLEIAKVWQAVAPVAEPTGAKGSSTEDDGAEEVLSTPVQTSQDAAKCGQARCAQQQGNCQ